MEVLMTAKTQTLISISSSCFSSDKHKSFLNPNPIPNLKFRLPTSSPSFNIPCLKSTISSSASRTAAQTRVDILSESLPFIQKFRGKTIVVKYGGAAMKSHALQSSVINDLVLLSVVGIRPILVHGGGPEINLWLDRLNIKSVFRDGLRVTDASTMEIVTMVLVGKVNKDLVALINKAGATAVGLSGLDGRLFTARPKHKSAELGFVGDVARVDPTMLRPLVDNNYIPVITPVAADETGQPYNINADTVAGELAAAFGAEKLILLTDVPGILENRDDPGSLVKEIDIKGVKKMMDDGKIGGGMIPKVNCCLRSLAQGVRTASIIDGRVPHSLLLEVLTDEGAGTMITGFPKYTSNSSASASLAFERSTIVARTGRHRQRYEDQLRLVAGCIPFKLEQCVEDHGDLENRLSVLMISSPNRDDFVFPKGGWENDEEIGEAASREALEESGVKGILGEKPLGVWQFRSKSRQNSCSLEGGCKGYMFAMQVTEELDSWPEMTNHHRKWLTPKDALKFCRYDWMQEALRELLVVLSEDQTRKASGKLPLFPCTDAGADHKYYRQPAGSLQAFNTLKSLIKKLPGRVD